MSRCIVYATLARGKKDAVCRIVLCVFVFVICNLCLGIAQRIEVRGVYVKLIHCGEEILVVTKSP